MADWPPLPHRLPSEAEAEVEADGKQARLAATPPSTVRTRCRSGDQAEAAPVAARYPFPLRLRVVPVPVVARAFAHRPPGRFYSDGEAESVRKNRIEFGCHAES